VEDFVHARLAEVAIHEDDPLAGLGNRDREIGGERRFAVAGVRAGHLNDLVAGPLRAEVQLRPHAAIRFRFD